MSDICEKIHRFFNARPRFRFPFDEAQIPLNGVYVLFERGELAHDGDRIVRVGTHTGQNQLRSRLKQHFLIENKDRSIFRKNIGRALLAQAKEEEFAVHWELDLTSSAARQLHSGQVDLDKKIATERAVSDRIRSAFTFAVVEIVKKEDRLCLESRLISTVSLCDQCRPSEGWLGRHSPKHKIRESGMWQVNELYKTACGQSDLDLAGIT